MSIKNNITSLQEVLNKINSLPEAGGVELPELTNEGIADDLVTGKELINSDGDIVTGTNPYAKAATDTEVATQADLIAQIQTILDSKTSGNNPDESGIQVCNVTINAFDRIYSISYTVYENGNIITKFSNSSDTSFVLSNVICGSAITFYNNYDFNAFTHSHDSKFVGYYARYMCVLSAPTTPNVNATITIFDDD